MAVGIVEHVCCATLSLSQDEGYGIVDDAGAKTEGRPMLENSYDASNEVFYNSLPEVRSVGESQVHCDHAIFV